MEEKAIKLIETVGKALEIPQTELTQKYVRAPRRVYDAQIICFDALLRIGFKVGEIKLLFNKENHSSVSHGLRNYRCLISCDRSFRSKAGLCGEAINQIIQTYRNEASCN